MLLKRNYNPTYLNMTGFPLRQENLETENGYGKVMEKSKNMKKKDKSHGILSSVMEFYKFCHEFYQICMLFDTTKRLSIDV